MTEPFFLRLYPITQPGCNVVAATRTRPWMKENPHVFKCGPVTNYNSFGWDLTTTEEIIVEWNGGIQKDDMYVVSPNSIAETNFGHGIITFKPGYTWHTPKGWSLVVTRIPNYDHGDFEPMDALIETDVLKYPIFPSAKLKKPGRYVIPKDTPVARVFPIQSGVVTECVPEILPEPEEFLEYRMWQAKERKEFLKVNQKGWQKFYHNIAQKPVVRMKAPENKFVDKNEQILIVDNYLTDEECDKLLHICKTTNDWKGQGDWKERLLWPEYSKNLAKKLITDRTSVCEEFFDSALKIDNVHCVIWREGNHMPPHSDYGAHDEYMHRDIASIIYLNDDYKGGDIYIPELNFSAKPKKGQLIAFNGGKLTHGVKEVKSGTRFTNICWFNILGKK